ncbi:MAG: hypothetical protein IIT97_00595 [Mycoplasmataceae bacterium]|nr:hypothetical protein [Mycoplasmataceae bacterium]
MNLWWKKLSKSAGWLVTVDNLEEKWYSALDLKLLYYTAHYRNFLDFNETVLEQSKVQRKNYDTIEEQIIEGINEFSIKQRESFIYE